MYYVLGDFAAYRETKDRMAADYRDQKAWNARVWANISRSGRFSSDRTISDYAREVWKIEGEPIARGVRVGVARTRLCPGLPCCLGMRVCQHMAELY